MLPLEPAELAGVWVTVDLDAPDLEARLRELELAGVAGVMAGSEKCDLRAWSGNQRAAARLCNELELPWRVVLSTGRDLEVRELRGRLDSALALEPAALDIELDDYAALGASAERCLNKDAPGFVVHLPSASRLDASCRELARKGAVVALRLPRLDEDALDEVRGALNDGALAAIVPALDLASARRLGVTTVDDGLALPAAGSTCAWWEALEQNLGSLDATSGERQLLRWIEGELQPRARRAALGADIATWCRADWEALLPQESDREALRSRIERAAQA